MAPPKKPLPAAQPHTRTTRPTTRAKPLRLLELPFVPPVVDSLIVDPHYEPRLSKTAIDRWTKTLTPAPSGKDASFDALWAAGVWALEMATAAGEVVDVIGFMPGMTRKGCAGALQAIVNSKFGEGQLRRRGAPPGRHPARRLFLCLTIEVKIPGRDDVPALPDLYAATPYVSSVDRIEPESIVNVVPRRLWELASNEANMLTLVDRVVPCSDGGPSLAPTGKRRRVDSVSSPSEILVGSSSQGGGQGSRGRPAPALGEATTGASTSRVPLGFKHFCFSPPRRDPDSPSASVGPTPPPRGMPTSPSASVGPTPPPRHTATGRLLLASETPTPPPRPPTHVSCGVGPSRPPSPPTVHVFDHDDERLDEKVLWSVLMAQVDLRSVKLDREEKKAILEAVNLALLPGPSRWARPDLRTVIQRLLTVRVKDLAYGQALLAAHAALPPLPAPAPAPPTPPRALQWPWSP